jgi:hypothetical protein
MAVGTPFLPCGARAVDSPEHAEADIDAKLTAWRQGDCVVGEQWFLYRVDPNRLLTAQSKEACTAANDALDVGTSISVWAKIRAFVRRFTAQERQAPRSDAINAEAPGLVVLTQTCDLVRRCSDRPFVELAPLYELSESDWRAAKRGRIPRFVVVPGLSSRRLAADLDRVMTVEKAVMAGWERVQGCHSDEEARLFALALARKRARFAFPDDFVALVEPLQRRLIDKHDKRSPEGEALRSLREIRVRAAPAWDAEAVDITFFFIRDPEVLDFKGTSWADLCDAWLERVGKRGRYADVAGLVQTLDDLTARDYVESDPLDLGYLSDRPD